MTAGKPYLITRLKLSGFRAYLEPVEFGLKDKPCLAVFGPNGRGKSSLVDAVEFLFSRDGTLTRLGLRKIHNQAGVEALSHNLAIDRGIDSFVEISFSKGTPPLTGVRSAQGAKRPRPTIVDEVDKTILVSPIVRGHELRSFVEQETAETRYESIARWLRLGPLVEAQKHIRALRQQVKAAAGNDDAFKAINRRLAKETANVVVVWDPIAVLSYLEKRFAEIDGALVPERLEASDSAYLIVCSRAKDEGERLGLAGLRQLRTAAAGVFETTHDPETDATNSHGLLIDWPAALASVQLSREAEARERAATANAMFARVWDAAEPLFATDKESPLVCPLCQTPIVESTAGSAADIRAHITRHKSELEAYAAAKKLLGETEKAAAGIRTSLIAALKGVQCLLPKGYDGPAALLRTHLQAVEAWKEGSAPASGSLSAALDELIVSIDKQINEIVRTQGEHSYSAAKTKADALLEIAKEHATAVRVRQELETLTIELNVQAGFISGLIRTKVQTLLDLLRGPVNDMYREIQGQSAAGIRIELPPEDDVNQQRLHLLVDFAPNREGVQPSGYLSDSQVHSLALALRLAAIKLFNTSAPIVVLDDVVTSYDADHRRATAALLAKEFESSQVIVVTHDERFFNYLKDQLPAKDWQFKRIYRLDSDYGPRFVDHKVSDEMISGKWSIGESAANEMRQAEEEWLLGICRDFGAFVAIRTTERAYSYDRAELASALATALKEAGLAVPVVPGVNNRFLNSLQLGTVENFGSHFQDIPYGDGSIGDEKVRWGEFVLFRGYFVCPKCGKARFKRPFGVSKPICAAEGCEAQFAFPSMP